MRPNFVVLAMSCLLLAACGGARQDLTIEFIPTLDGQALDGPLDGQALDGQALDGPTDGRAPSRLDGQTLACNQSVGAAALTDLRFYVSNPVLISASGERVPVELVANGRWQGEGLTLIDLENGADNCLNGTRDTNALLRGTVPAGDYRGLAFTVGVPFTMNHANPLTAAAPLNDSTMHWHWRSGYKFFRAGLQVGDDRFSIHLGSAACEGTVQAIRSCQYPNRFDVALDDWTVSDRVSVDLSRLLQRAKSQGLLASNCTAGPSETACGALFPAFGLDFGSGKQVDRQSLFRTRPQ